MSKKIILLSSTFIALLIIGGLFMHYQEKVSPRDDFKRCSDEYPFVSPELDCGVINEKIEQFKELDNKIETLVNAEEQSGNVSQISVFFRDLNSRQWFGVNENVNFYPASLAKLPIAMMFYKAAEVNKKILMAPLTITEDDVRSNENQNYKPLETLEPNKDYPVQELLRRILVYSDNAPIDPLMQASKSFIAPTLTDLGIFLESEDGNEENSSWNINAKTYANLFRILYNASYLRPEYSNKILNDLSQSRFRNGLTANIPEEIKVSHKFGEMSHVNKSSNKNYLILNDCGIIYKKDSPYILCIMTQGENFENLEKAIQKISKTVYESL